MVARPLAEKLRGKYAESLLLDSRPGAGGRIAAEYVKRAAPDGLTILQIPSSPMALYPHIYRKLHYDPLADFVAGEHAVHLRRLVHRRPGAAGRDQDRGRLRRSGPRPTRQAGNYGIPAAGSALHFAGMMLQKAAEFDFNSVPYRGGAPLLQDVLGGQVPVSFNVLGEVLPYDQERQAALAGGDQPAALAVPARGADAGRAGLSRTSRCRSGSAGSCRRRRRPTWCSSLNAQVREGLQSPDLIEALARNGLQPMHQSPEEFAAHASRRDLGRWGPIVKATGFKAEE